MDNPDMIKVTVTNTLTGAEMLRETPLLRRGLIDLIKQKLGHRASKPIRVFDPNVSATIGLDNRFTPPDVDSILLQALQTNALSQEQRDQFLSQIASSDADLSEKFRRWPLAARDDPEIVASALEKEPWCLEFASMKCKGDKRLVLSAIEQNPSVIMFASDALKDSPDVMTRTVELDAWCLLYAGETCKNSKKLVSAAVEKQPRSLQFASAECRDDIPIVRKAVKRDSACFKYAGEVCKKDPYVLQLMQKSQPAAQNPGLPPQQDTVAPAKRPRAS